MEVTWHSTSPKQGRGKGRVRWQVTSENFKELERLWVPSRRGTHRTFEIRVRQSPGSRRWIAVKTRVDNVARDVQASKQIGDPGEGEVDVDGRAWRLQVARLGRLAVVGRLLGAFAHDLAQPLTSILSNAQAAQKLLSDEPVSLEEMRGIITDIISADIHANALIQKVRALLKRRATKFECVELSDAIRDATSFLTGELAVHRVEVATRIDPDVPAVKADSVQLGQVLLNLLLNAVQAMGRTPLKRRQVVIRVRRAGATVEVAVEDAGKGLEAGQLERMFDPFYTTKKSGLGLGLWLCKTIVAAHRGRLWVTRNEGPGITVHFTLLPYSKSAVRPIHHHASPAATVHTTREAGEAAQSEQC